MPPRLSLSDSHDRPFAFGRADRLAMVALLAWLVALPVPLLEPAVHAADATPVAEAAGTPRGTRTYVAHAARFAAAIPAAWRPRVGPPGPLFQEFVYAGGDGLAWGDAVRDAATFATVTGGTIEDACRREAKRAFYGASPTFEPQGLRGAQGCVVRPSPDQPADLLGLTGLVLPHPTPFDGLYGRVEYVALRADRDHFRAIAGSLDFSPAAVSPTAYLESTLDLMEAFSIEREEVDWLRARDEARAAAAGASTWEQAYRGIWIGLDHLAVAGDRHSGFFTPAEVDRLFQPEGGPAELPTGRRLGDDLGYVALPAVAGDTETFVAYATEGQRVVEEVDRSPTCGWVVDLRGNMGGSYVPMVVGVGAILGEGVFGGFLDAAGTTTLLSYADGRILDNGVDFFGQLVDGPPTCSSGRRRPWRCSSTAGPPVPAS